MAAITTLYDTRGARFKRSRGARARRRRDDHDHLQPSTRPRGHERLGARRVGARAGRAHHHHDLYVPRLRTLTDACTRTAARPACSSRSTDSGRGRLRRAGGGAVAIGRALEARSTAGLERLSFIREGRPAAVGELHAIQRDVAAAAVRGVKAGFDVVQLQALGGNFISRFLSPLTNSGPTSTAALSRTARACCSRRSGRSGARSGRACRSLPDQRRRPARGRHAARRLRPARAHAGGAGIDAIDVMPAGTRRAAR